ncbi:MAG: hypothetical protein KatS3mg130_1626 [Candidatus Sumerlaea sp.]|nr:MAG: hypothetical protein KatS3mg130_1626 [Candidatus Sumerlaea sp.]
MQVESNAIWLLLGCSDGTGANRLGRGAPAAPQLGVCVLLGCDLNCETLSTCHDLWRNHGRTDQVSLSVKRWQAASADARLGPSGSTHKLLRGGFSGSVIGAALYAVVMRFWNLAAKPLHHDESLFAYYSYFLARGYGYQYQPILHGPILEHVTALVFLLFGDSDLTMRLPAAVGSLALFPLAWYWRRYLGQTGMIVSFLLLAVSPTILYYSRFLRNDAPYLAATVWCALCVLRAFETGQSRYFWGGLLAATIMFCMMESSIFFFAACLGYFAVIVMFDLVRGLGCDPTRPKQFPGDSSLFCPKRAKRARAPHS